MQSKSEIALHLERTHRILRGATSREKRSQVGQFLTPVPIARFMASLFEGSPDEARILDAGAGTGTLFAALVAELCSRPQPPTSIAIVAFENDKKLAPHLDKTVSHCQKTCAELNIRFDATLFYEDFISAAIPEVDDGLFGERMKKFTHAILNPPYKKINRQANIRKSLNTSGFETSNLYSAFVWLAARLLTPGGELVAITPRSFCNGPYFRRFRRSLLDLVGLRHIHLFESRKEAFADDSVLQENIIFYGVRGEYQRGKVCISVSKGTDFTRASVREVPFQRVVLPGDPDVFIHVIEDDDAKQIMQRMGRFNTTLDELGLTVSTGRVVEFRCRRYLRQNAEHATAPLIYPCHFEKGFVKWPLPNGRKPNAIVSSDETQDVLVTAGHYVLTRRFSAKEEYRRVVAAIYDPERIDAHLVGFENHLNYFHSRGKGMPAELAKGLLIFLNSTLFDRYFRLFSGHTQVNATDLRKMRYPSRGELLRLGKHVKNFMPDQEKIDVILEQECGLDE